MEPASRERGKNLVKEFVAQVLEGSMTIARDAEMMINARIAQIDHLVSIQLNEIMHHPSFQKLEATWRGVKYLMDQSETGDMLKIKVLNCGKKELLQATCSARRSSTRAPCSRRSTKKSTAFSAARRSAPWWATTSSASTPKTSNCWNRSPTWRRPLMRLLHGGQRRHAEPGQLHQPGCSARPGEDLRHHRVRQVEELPPVGRFALRGACLPRVLGRLPYGKDTKPVEDFNYEEHVDGTDHSKYLWMNAASLWPRG